MKREDLELADTERPPCHGVLVTNDAWSTMEPTWFSSLIEATTEPPRTSMASIRDGFSRLVLANGVIQGGRWLYTAEGKARLEEEARGILARDYDTALALVLGDDLTAVAS